MEYPLCMLLTGGRGISTADRMWTDLIVHMEYFDDILPILQNLRYQFLSKIWLKFMENSTRISQGTGAPIPKVDVQTYFGNVHQKLRELETNWTKRGCVSVEFPLDPHCWNRLGFNNHWKVNIQTQQIKCQGLLEIKKMAQPQNSELQVFSAC